MKPGEGILNIAKEVNASLIITGSRGQSKLRRTFLGSVCITRPFPCWFAGKKIDQGKCKKIVFVCFFKRNINRILWNVFINLSANILQVLLYTVCLVYVLCIMFFFICVCVRVYIHYFLFFACIYIQ